jgi:hypothetical protein
MLRCPFFFIWQPWQAGDPSHGPFFRESGILARPFRTQMAGVPKLLFFLGISLETDCLRADRCIQ